jgi:Domain of unknown function (DUF1972)
MKIAILGTRGIPASYSGFETAVEQLASWLTARGHEAIVYFRAPRRRPPAAHGGALIQPLAPPPGLGGQAAEGAEQRLVIDVREELAIERARALCARAREFEPFRAHDDGD